MAQDLSPFHCSHTPNFPELLYKLRISLVLSTYQAGKIILLSAPTPEKLIQLPRNFDKAMGLDYHDQKLVLATRDEVTVFGNSPELAAGYPSKPDTYDALFVPQNTYYTGAVDIHDVAFGKKEIYGVNTAFSCLCTMDNRYSFRPIWRPKFIDELLPEDRCHLNGLALKDQKPYMISALGQGNTAQSWRENITQGGVLIDIESNEIVADQLPMPHSPRYHDGQVYFVCSASGQVFCLDTKTGKLHEFYTLKGFLRGLSIHGDFMFIGHSRLRTNSSSFAKLDIAEHAQWAGISVLHIPTASLVAQLRYSNSVDELYEVKVLPQLIRPNILNHQNARFRNAIYLPEQAFWTASK